MLHVFIFSAAFPFFSVVDEQMHVDLVVDYSQGKIPRTMMTANAEAVPFLALYGSPEYLHTNVVAPPWIQSMDSVRDGLAAKQSFYLNEFRNDEASQPPLYYLLAGAWWRFGKILNLDGLALLYWLRFLNVIFIAAIVRLCWFAAQKIFPENKFVQITASALIAFMPQTIFYAVNNDILSPLTFGTAFLLLANFWQKKIPNVPLGIVTGLALAASFLTKISNLPLLAVAAIFVLIKIRHLAKEKNLSASFPSIAALILAGTVPALIWIIWCKLDFGDWTGSKSKIEFLGWTHRPIADWLHHPIFTPRGFWIFLSGNLETFWRGETLWHSKPLAATAADLFYAILSLVLIALSIFYLLKKSTSQAQRSVLWFALVSFVAALVFFAFLSIIYDFQNCYYPSREHPYFTSGRLLLGVLIPFFLLIAFGLDCFLRKFGMMVKFTTLTGIVLLMLGFEIATDWPVFQSQYNWFHI